MEAQGWPLQEGTTDFRLILLPLRPAPAASPAASRTHEDLTPVTSLDFSALKVSSGKGMTKERPPEGKKELEN